jgi:alpha-tubulin suppressor-like RCC1 family protein
MLEWRDGRAANGPLIVKSEGKAMSSRSFLSDSTFRCRHSNRPSRWLRGLLASALVGVMSGCQEDAESPTGPTEATSSPSVALAASALSFSQVDAGDTHTCGITTDNLAYCWGDNWAGQLGDGTTTGHLTPGPVQGGLRFRQISAGWGHTCALTTDNRAYCWGLNDWGQIGDGTGVQRLTPTPVATTSNFRQIDAGTEHTCAVGYSDRLPYCWGSNHYGELGEGTRNPHFTPLAAAGKLSMREVHTGYYHTCGVTTGNLAYCWGDNEYGQLGQSTPGSFSTKPIRVSGGLQFRNATTGWWHSCGVTTGDRVYCWGRGTEGQLGDRTESSRFAPRPVAGSVLFTRATGGGYFTCAESRANTAYCWGENGAGQGGNGSSARKLRPTPVSGGLAFAQVSAGYGHTCGKTPGSVLYCWGWNPYGQVGDGTTTNRFSPVPVAGTI